MKNRKIIAILFIIIALVLGTFFFLEINLPETFNGYFNSVYYNQFGPLAISIELLIAGYYLFKQHLKTNFALAVFAFTALLDPLFNLTGLFTSLVPLNATIILVGCALVAFWLSFSNTFALGRISMLGAFGSFILGAAVELFFNLWTV